MTSEYHKKAIARIKPEDRTFMINSISLLSRINFLMERKGLNEFSLASKLNTVHTEVNKMLSPGYNFDLKTLAKLETILGDKIFECL